MIAQHDGPPKRGQFHTSLWEEGDSIVDEHDIPVKADATKGPWRLAVGLYDPKTGERLPVADSEGRPQPDRMLILDKLPAR
ncbi:MAG: hypothetical protein M1531_02770 [Chloroflexi bacterium]|nr:hypothetical protein [Chloroflexota bacterium]